MDLDIPKLAAETAALLAPFLPYLIKGGKIAAKAAFEETGKKFVDSVWDKAEELWGKLKPKVKSNPSAQGAIEKAARKPDDPRVLGNLEVELEEIFEQDISFAQTIKAGNYSVLVSGNVENTNILNNSNNNRIVHAENYYEGAPQNGNKADKSQNAFRSYLEKLRRHCNALPLAALGGDDADEDITLDKIYVDLDTTQFKETKEEYQGKARSGRNESTARDEKKPVSVMEVTAESKKLVLLGDAGAGKITFVKELLALQAAVLLGEMKEPLAGFDRDLIPVLIALRDLSPKLAALNLGNLSAESQAQVLSDAMLEKICEIGLTQDAFERRVI